jgi:hypothetical protein
MNDDNIDDDVSAHFSFKDFDNDSNDQSIQIRLEKLKGTLRPRICLFFKKLESISSCAEFNSASTGDSVASHFNFGSEKNV